MPTIRRQTVPSIVRPAGNRTRPSGVVEDASTFGNLRQLATDPSKPVPDTEQADASAELIAQRDAAAARFPNYFFYTGKRVNGAQETPSPGAYARVRFVVTSDPEQVRNLRATTPGTDYIRYADGSYGFIVGRTTGTEMRAPAVDFDIPRAALPSDQPQIANMVRVARHVGVSPGMTTTYAGPLLGAGIENQNWDASDRADAQLMYDALPKLGGTIPDLRDLAFWALNVQSLPGYARTMADRFAALREIAEATAELHPTAQPEKRVEVVDDQPPASTQPPRLRITGMPPRGTIYDGTTRLDTATGRWLDTAQTVFSMPITAGTHTVRIVPPTGGGNARTATVVVPATGEVPLTFSEMTEERPASTPPRLRITGMPPYGSLFVDGAPVTAGSWSNPATFDAWVVPITAGTHTVRIVPPTGGGNARTATVVVPATGEVPLTFSAMTEERPAATPEERLPAVTTGTIVYQPTAPDTSFETTTSAAVRAGAGLTAITLAPSGDNYSATVPAGTYTLEVIVQPFNGAPVPAGTPQPPARQYTIPVTITAGQTTTIARSQLTGAGTPLVGATPDPTPVTPRPGTGRVVIRSTLPNVAAMVQSLTGTQGELGPGRTATRATDGSLVIDGLTPGRSQLVVWQEAEFPAVGRANVQQAPVTVIAGADSVYSYTGTALTYVGGGTTGGSVNPSVSTPPVLSPDAARGAYAQALFNAGASRSFVFLSLLGR